MYDEVTFSGFLDARRSCSPGDFFKLSVARIVVVIILRLEFSKSNNRIKQFEEFEAQPIAHHKTANGMPLQKWRADVASALEF